MRRIAAGALALLLVACALPPAPETAITTALVDTLPVDLPQAPRVAATVLVLRPEARPAYDTLQMAYTRRPHELAYYGRHQWAETPPRMLQPLLVRSLEGTGRFSAVLAPPHAGAATYALHTDILELLQDFTQEPPALRLALRARLSEGATGRVLATREIVLRQPMREQAPHAGVVAANEAMAQALRQLAAFVVEEAR